MKTGSCIAIAKSLVFGAAALGLAASALAVDLPDHAPTPDEAFVTAAMQGGLDEIELSRLAMRAAESPGVRDFAARMVSEHTERNAALATIAQAANIALPVAPDSAHMQLRDKLAPLKGAEFDKNYVEGMRTDHQKMVELLTSASTTVANAGLRGYIQKTLPVVKRHLRMAQDLKVGEQ